jgi:hypothetical protein
VIGAGGLIVALTLVWFAWYPKPYFEIQHAARTLPFLSVVCLVFGPLLTFLVFKPGKRGLRSDLVVIALLQVAAFTFSMYKLYVERPYFMVFALDRVHVLTARDVPSGISMASHFPDNSRRHPIMAVALLPSDPGKISRLTWEILLEGKPDIERRPEHWMPYAASISDVKSAAGSISLLRDIRPDSVAEIDRQVAASGLQPSELLFVPVMGKRDNHVVIIRKADAVILDAVELNRGL